MVEKSCEECLIMPICLYRFKNSTILYQTPIVLSIGELPKIELKYVKTNGFITKTKQFITGIGLLDAYRVRFIVSGKSTISSCYYDEQKIIEEDVQLNK